MPLDSLDRSKLGDDCKVAAIGSVVRRSNDNTTALPCKNLDVSRFLRIVPRLKTSPWSVPMHAAKSEWVPEPCLRWARARGDSTKRPSTVSGAPISMSETASTADINGPFEVEVTVNGQLHVLSDAKLAALKLWRMLHGARQSPVWVRCVLRDGSCRPGWESTQRPTTQCSGRQEIKKPWTYLPTRPGTGSPSLKTPRGKPCHQDMEWPDPAEKFHSQVRMHKIAPVLPRLTMPRAEVPAIWHETTGSQRVALIDAVQRHDAFRAREAVELPEGATALRLDLSGRRLGPREVKLIMQNLPPGVQHLDLRLRNCGVAAETAAALMCSLPVELKGMALDLSYCDPGDAGVAALAGSLPEGLQRIHIDLTGCSISHEALHALRTAVSALPQMAAPSIIAGHSATDELINRPHF